MLEPNKDGYLMDSQQILQFAKWYLANPLMAVKHNNLEFYPYNQTDIKRVKKIIKDIHHGKKMMAFRLQSYKDTFADDGTNRFTLSNWQDHTMNSPVLDLHGYLKYLKKQTVVDWNYVVAYAQKVNAKIRQSARYDNKMITKSAQQSSKRIQYKKFIDNRYDMSDVLKEFKRSNLPVKDNFNMNFIRSLAIYHCHMVRLYGYDSAHSHLTPIEYVKENHIASETVQEAMKKSIIKSDVYGLVAFYAYSKWKLKYAHLHAFKPAKCFKSDVNLKNLSGNFNFVLHKNDQIVSSYNVTNPHEMIDYKRFVLHKE